MRLSPEEIIAPELTASENVRWIGLPFFGRVLFQGLRSIVIGLSFAVAPWLFSISANGNSSGEEGIFVWIAFLFGGLSYSYSGLVDIISLRRTAFAITDRRALMVRRFLGVRVRSFYSADMNILECHIDADGSGSILFRAEEFAGLEAAGVAKIGFRGVRDVSGARWAIMQLRVSSMA